MANLRLIKCDVARVAQPATSYRVVLARGSVQELFDGRGKFVALVRYREQYTRIFAPLDWLIEFDDPVGSGSSFEARYFSFDWLSARRQPYDGKLKKGSLVDVAVEQVLRVGPIGRFWRYIPS